VEGFERLSVSDRLIFGAANVLQPGVFRADARVIEAGRNRMCLDDLAILVL